jgi:hypothetical protein
MDKNSKPLTLEERWRANVAAGGPVGTTSLITLYRLMEDEDSFPPTELPDKDAPRGPYIPLALSWK